MTLIEENNKRLEQADKDFLWHPFTQMKEWTEDTPIIIEEARDCFLKDIYGRWFLDGVSSLWVNLHGHRHPAIDSAIIEQLGKVAHTTLLGLSNVPAIELAALLVETLGETIGTGAQALKRVFYSDNGSTAVEVALKMAFQYWKHKGISGRESFIALQNSYHGDTIGAVSVGGIDIFHKTYEPLLFKVYKSPSPYCYRCEFGLDKESCSMECLKAMEALLTEHEQDVAAVIVEPMIQCAGGMITAPRGFLKGVESLCRKHNVLLIADEVATGFGRTGEMFACQHENVMPNMICLSKGITGGYMPLAVTITTEQIYSAFLGDLSELKTFYHGHSYTGNPLACAAAIASLKVLKGYEPSEAIRILGGWLESILGYNHVGDARGIGLMAGVELVRDKSVREPYEYSEKMGWKVALELRKKGIILRPLGNVIVIMPPLSIKTDNLQTMLSQIEEAIRSI